MDINRPPASFLTADLKTDLKERLLNRLHWMHTMRWFAAGVGLTAMLFSMQFGNLDLPYSALAFMLVLLAACNLAYGFRIGKFDPETTDLSFLNSLIYTEIAADFLILAGLIHLTGGVSNFFAFYFVFHIVIASILVPRKVGYALAGAATVLVGGIAIAEMNGVLPHYSLGPFEPGDAYRQPGYVFHFMVIFSGLLFIMAYIASNLRQMLQRRERFLTELKEKLELWNQQCMTANERLVEIDRTKTQFMHLSGHEIRSPLSAMLSIMRTILEGYVKDKVKILEMIGLANRRANEALEITNKLLQLAREKGKDLSVEKFDVVVETQSILDDIRELAVEKSVHIDMVEPEQKPIIAEADRESFWLATENIISNAIKFSYPDGKVTVHVEKWRNKGMIIVVDHGIGIPEEFMPGIYDEFSRARNARKHEPAGTGLGMPIVRQAAVNMGGTVTVRSINSQGTVVRLTVPLVETDETPEDEIQNSRPRASSPG